MRTVVYESGPFVNVEYFFHPDLPADIGAIKFWFQKKVFFVIVKPDDDSLEMTEEKIDRILEGQGYKSTHMSHEIPWKLAIGNHVRWIWTLTNQQNYLDGLQFEFSDNVSQKSVIIQLLAIASRIEIKTVH
jgi:hypothetical protein